MTSYNVTGLQPDTKYKIQVGNILILILILITITITITILIILTIANITVPAGGRADQERRRNPVPASDGEDPRRSPLQT